MMSSMPDLSDRVTLVTGASRGAGAAIAAVLGEGGATVYVTGRSSRAGARTDDMPGTVLTSMVKGVDVSVLDTVKDVRKGQFQAGMHAFGLAEHGVDYVHDGPHGAGIPDDVKVQIEALRALRMGEESQAA